MKKMTTWILATACLATIGGTLQAANEMNLAPSPWAAPAPAPAPPTVTITNALPIPDQPAAGSTVTINVHSDTTWTTTSSETWAAITAPGTGNKDGSVTVTLSANTGTTDRTVGITVSATDDPSVYQTVQIKQLAPNQPVTNVTLLPDKDTITVGGTLPLTATIVPSTATTQTVTWTSSGPAVTVPTGETGLLVTVTGAAPGDATITVTTDDQNKTATCQVHVKAAMKPALSITSPSMTTLDHPAATGSIDVTFTSNANWKVSSNQGWVSIAPPATGNGNGNVKLNVETNTGAARTANVKFETTTGANDTTVTLIIQQAGAGPTLALEDTAALNNMPFTGGDKVVKVKSNTTWAITSSADWVLFLDTQGGEQSARQGGNDQNVTVRVRPNNTHADRKATLTFKTTQSSATNVTKTVTITQAASGFTYSFSNLSEPVSADSVNVKINLNSSIGYAVSVRGTDWLKLLDDTNVEKDSLAFATGGQRTCTLRIKSNTSGLRVGHIRIYSNGVLVETRQITQTDNKLTVQIEAPGNIPVNGGTKKVTVSSHASWEMLIAGDWLKVEKKEATSGNDTLITFRAASKNTSLMARTATVTFQTKTGQSKQTITIKQDGSFSMNYDKDVFEKVSEEGANLTVAVKSEAAWMLSVMEIPATTKSGQLRAKVTEMDTTLTWLSLTYERENATRNDGTIKIKVKPNITLSSREAKILLKTTGGTTLDTIAVKQYNVNGKMTPHAAVTPVAGLKLDKTSVTINGEKNVQLSVTVTPDNATNKNVTWASSDTTIATVDAKGLVTIGKKKGKATITVTAADGSGVKAACLVDVLIPQANIALADMKVYAAAGHLHLALPAAQEVHIYNVSGALIRSFTAPAGDTSVALPSGLYIVRVGRLTEKVAVE